MSDPSLGYVGGYTVALSDSFTRPANTTAYTSGDLVANSATAGSVVPLAWDVARTDGGSGKITRAVVRFDDTVLTNAQFRLHLYTVSPTPANGDNGAWSTDGYADWLGALDVTVDMAFSDGAAGSGVPNAGSGIAFDLRSRGSRTIYGVLEARAGYTPTSGEVFTVTIEVDQN